MVHTLVKSPKLPLWRVLGLRRLFHNLEPTHPLALFALLEFPLNLGSNSFLLLRDLALVEGGRVLVEIIC